MAGIAAGVVTAGEVNSPMGNAQSGPPQPGKWSWIWFLIATGYLVGVYYGMITIRREG